MHLERVHGTNGYLHKEFNRPARAAVLCILPEKRPWIRKLENPPINQKAVSKKGSFLFYTPMKGSKALPTKGKKPTKDK